MSDTSPSQAATPANRKAGDVFAPSRGSAADVATPQRPDEKLGAAPPTVESVILEIWDADINRVEQWLRRCHPELITNSGRTCWGELLDRLENTQPPNVLMSRRENND